MKQKEKKALLMIMKMEHREMVYLLKYLCYGHGACLVNWIVEEKFWLIKVGAMFHLVHLCCTSCCKSHCTHSNNQSPVSLLSYDINACQISAWVSALRCQFLSLVLSFCQVSCPELCGIIHWRLLLKYLNYEW